MSPFDFINAINSKQKQDLIRASNNPEMAEKLYKPFVVNKGLSYFVDTIMYANEMNRATNIDNLLQNDYYLNSIRPAKRVSKWHKKLNDEDIEGVQEYFKVGFVRAQEIVKTLTSEQLDLIKTIITKGNSSNDVRRKQTCGGET